MNHDTCENYLTVKDIMRDLRISKNTAYKLIHEKGIPCVKINGRMRIRVSDYNEWVLANIVDESEKVMNDTSFNFTMMMWYEYAILKEEEMHEVMHTLSKMAKQIVDGRKTDYPVASTPDAQRFLDHVCDLNGIKRS